MRPIPVVAIDEGIEARLLLQDIRGRRFGGFELQRPRHPLVPAVLLGMPRLDALDPNAKAEQVRAALARFGGVRA
jgi:hypothetical protein